MRGGLGNDEADQIGVKAGQSEQRPSHYSSHGVANEHHVLRRDLQMLVKTLIDVLSVKSVYMQYWHAILLPCLKLPYRSSG